MRFFSTSNRRCESDAGSEAVLMLGYMSRESLAATLASGKVTFFSRSKRRLWAKGETSGNTLQLVSLEADCDRDSLLVLAKPHGPTCHNGTTTCFGEFPGPELAFLGELERLIEARHRERPAGSSFSLASSQTEAMSRAVTVLSADFTLTEASL